MYNYFKYHPYFFPVTVSDSDDDNLPPALAQNSDTMVSHSITNVSQHYDSYVSLIDDDDDYEEDTYFLAAIEASISDQQKINENNYLEDDVEDVLKQFVSENMETSDPDDIVKIVISRKDVYHSTLRGLNRASFSFFKPVKVTFSGEAAVGVQDVNTCAFLWKLWGNQQSSVACGCHTIWVCSTQSNMSSLANSLLGVFYKVAQGQGVCQK